MVEREGVIKFRLDFIEGPLPATEGLQVLDAWRTVLFRTGLIGQDPARYGGLSYGNVSLRLPPCDTPPHTRHFLVSGTQTSGLAEAGAAHYAMVLACHPEANRVQAQGPVRPSSEAMTHGILYGLDDALRCVLHVHSPEIWRTAQALALPVTDARVPYGTPAMAQEVQRLFRETDVRAQGIFAMGGHEDGAVSFGRTVDEAACILLRALTRAIAFG